MLSVRPDAGRFALLATILALGLCLAVGLAMLPPTLSIVPLAGCALVALVLALRRGVSWQDGRPTRRLTSIQLQGSASTLDSDDGSHFKPARTLYYLGLLTLSGLHLRPSLSLTLSDWLFFAALLAACIEVGASRTLPKFTVPKPLIIGLAIFVAGGLASSAGARQPWESTGIVMRLIYITALWFWLGTVVLRTSQHVRRAILFWVLSVALAGFAAAIELVLGDVIPGTSTAFGRVSGLAQHVNDLGGLTAVALVPALCLVTMARGVVRTLISVVTLIAIE